MSVVVSAFKLLWLRLVFDPVLQFQTLGPNDLPVCVFKPQFTPVACAM